VKEIPVVVDVNLDVVVDVNVVVDANVVAVVCVAEKPLGFVQAHDSDYDYVQDYDHVHVYERRSEGR